MTASVRARRLRRLPRAAARVLLAAVLGGGWALLAAMPIGAALITWWGGLG